MGVLSEDIVTHCNDIGVCSGVGGSCIHSGDVCIMHSGDICAELSGDDLSPFFAAFILAIFIFTEAFFFLETNDPLDKRLLSSSIV